MNNFLIEKKNKKMERTIFIKENKKKSSLRVKTDTILTTKKKLWEITKINNNKIDGKFLIPHIPKFSPFFRFELFFNHFTKK